MNLQPEEKTTEITVSPEASVSELLRVAKILHKNPAWRTTHFEGTYGPMSSTRLTEARAHVQWCVWKLEKILEEIK